MSHFEANKVVGASSSLLREQDAPATMKKVGGASSSLLREQDASATLQEQDAREVFILKRGRQRLAELRPLPRGRTLRSLPNILTSLPRLSATESKSFEKDMVALRKGSRREEVKDPWIK